ncbi:polysaccharide biosynthesis tyrosine autokinase [Pedobacter petrophilus]|uniref:non-specific protein-tyrosine kinase n=1 Tax=Pedobacter petrophilus TaxID=1908241 RepID=A0A7K0G4Q3_9SPHI|nr:polysaccharide biosynthesis tyrosine autokinase [Pedobacter petrophilus]MRX78219.1 polysaccharide biosynthesis tyrosine autokinase [Pedobacter petrophilus]
MNSIPEQNLDLRAEDETLDIRKIILKLLDNWYLYLGAVLISLIIAYFYSKYTPPIYQISSKVLVNSNDKGGSPGAQGSALMDLGGIMGGKSSVDNEVEILRTRFLMEQVVRQMELNIVYQEKVGFKKREIYQTPIKLSITKALDTISQTLVTVDVTGSNTLKVSANDFEKEIRFNEEFNLNGVGIVKLIPTGIAKLEHGKFLIQVSSIDDRVAELQGKMTVGVTNKQVTIMDLGLSYPHPRKGEDILRAIINRYISSSLEEKNIIADSTTTFIQKRLSIISGELGDVENKQERFKQNNKLTDMSEQSKLLVQSTSAFTNELAKAETQITVLSELEGYLKDESKNKRVFPASLLSSDMVFSGIMSQYNSLLIERDKRLLSDTEESPFIKNIDEQISGLRAGLLSNIQSSKNSYIITRDKLRSQLNQAEGRGEQVPQIEKDYLKLARNQQIKQELYIFLMQKAEETAISKTSNLAIAKTIDPPKSAIAPISPKQNTIYLIAIVIGLIIPTVFIILINLLNTTVSTKEDITSATITPIIGEINHNSSTDNLIVAHQGRSAISEQFRALRTNLSFYLKTSSQKVILLTSTASGEGKSFTAINLGNILALAGKKVLLMELDLRKPGLSAKLGVANTTGFSNYTIDPSVKVQHIIKPLAINPNMFIISSGPLPPNPAETIMSEHTDDLIAQLKEQFDYIIMDAPPVGIITDAQLLAKYADATLYIIRQKVTQKNQLYIVDQLYRTQRMNNLGIVVNDIVPKDYGYGYGYGSYGENETNSTFKSLLKKFRG